MTPLQQRLIQFLTIVLLCFMILLLLAYYNQNVYEISQEDFLEYAAAHDFNETMKEIAIINLENNGTSERPHMRMRTLPPEERLTQLCYQIDTIDRTKMTSTKFTKMAMCYLKNDGTVVVTIHAYDQLNSKRTSGDDVIVLWAVEKDGDGRVSGEVIDHKNGSYTGFIKIFWTGLTVIRAKLVSSIINTCLKIKAGKKYGNNVFALKQGWGIRGTFKNKKRKESTPCGANPTIFGYMEICNFTELNDGMSWYCGKPKINFLKCSDIFSFGTAKFNTNWAPQEEKIHNKAHGIIMSQVMVNVPYKANLTQTISCPDIPPQVTWENFNPNGLWYNGTWQTSYCKHELVTNLEYYRKCLSGKTFVILGDSTNRQYGDFLVQEILGISKKFVQNEVGVRGKYHAFNNFYNKYNITVKYLKHEMPYHNPGFTKNGIISIPHLIDTFSSQNISDLVLLANYNSHYTAYPFSVYRARQRSLKEAYKRLSIANPTAKLFLKTPHLVIDDTKWFDPYRQMLDQRIIREEFADIKDKVILLDTWSISVAHKNERLHPENYAMLSQMLQFLSYVC